MANDCVICRRTGRRKAERVKLTVMTSDHFRPTYPLVLIFGAGASKGSLAVPDPAPPVDVDFFDVANTLKGHGTPRLAKQVLRSVWELNHRVSGVGLEEYYRDIETRAAISRIAKSANKPKNWEKRQKQLEELIRRVYVHTTADLSQRPPAPKASAPHREILKKLKPGCTIITFNYDMLIEESFENAKLWNPKDGYGTAVHGTTLSWCKNWLDKRKYIKGTRSSVSLLKLHGSLGWTIYKNRQIRLKPRPFTVRKGKSEQISVLPPGWNKRIHTNPYRIFWREARLKMERCRSLMIVGYSLPETDLLAKSLFAEVVRSRTSRNQHLKQLILVDPSQSVRERFIRLFTPALGPVGNVVQFKNIAEFQSETRT